MENSMPELKKEFAHTLRQLDFEAMPISRYNKDYISHIMKNIEYYIDIYDYCFRIFDESGINEKDQYTMVDYGGGHGFLSMYAQKRGMDRIIYVDKNPDSVHTAKYLKEVTGLGADVMICGDENDLVKYCDDNGITPNLLVGIDVIEHIYDINKYLRTLSVKWPFLEHLYTTASTPYNPIVSRRLRRLMKEDEYGTRKKIGYLELRRRYVAKHYPDISSKEVNIIARKTRGLTYEDIDFYMQNKLILPEIDRYNTCDPATGNWTERILALKDYEKNILKYGYCIFEFAGFYNTNCSGLKLRFAEILNKWICTNLKGKCIAPFVIMWMKQIYLKEKSPEDIKVAKTNSEEFIVQQVKKRQIDYLKSLGIE